MTTKKSAVKEAPKDDVKETDVVQTTQKVMKTKKNTVKKSLDLTRRFWNGLDQTRKDETIIEVENNCSGALAIDKSILLPQFFLTFHCLNKLF